MQQFFQVIHVLTAVGIIALVLLQQGRGADAGAAFGSGSSGTLFGARGPTSFFSRLTGILAAVFFLTSLALAYMVTHSTERESVVQRQLAEETELPVPEKQEELSIPPIPSAPGDSVEQAPAPGASGLQDIPPVPAKDDSLGETSGDNPLQGNQSG